MESFAGLMRSFEERIGDGVLTQLKVCMKCNHNTLRKPGPVGSSLPSPFEVRCILSPYRL